MKTTGIRIDVSQDFYLKLLEEQETQRVLTGKKTSLAAVILKFSEWGLKNRNEMKTTQTTEFYPKQVDLQNDWAKNNMFSVREKDQIAKEKELKSWEADLRSREFALIEESKTINESSETLMKQRNDIYDQKEKMQEKALEALKQSILNENLEKALAEKNAQFQNLQQEFSDMKRNMYKTLVSIDRKTESSTFERFILPLLPLVGSVVGTYILYDKIQPKENLSPSEKEILRSFNELESPLQEEIKLYLKDLLNKSN